MTLKYIMHACFYDLNIFTLPHVYKKEPKDIPIDMSTFIFAVVLSCHWLPYEHSTSVTFRKHDY